MSDTGPDTYRTGEHGFWRKPPVGESRSLPAAGIYLHCVEAGGGDKTLVMVHGLGGSWDNWLPVLAPLSERYHCLVPDLPGFGRSAKPEAPYTVAWFAATLREMLRGLPGCLPAVLAGNSLGGHICLEYALRWPEEVAALILSAPAGAHPYVPVRNRAMLALYRLFGWGPLLRLGGPTALPLFVRRLFYRCGPECRQQIDFYRRYLRSPEYPLFRRAALRATRSHLNGSLLARLAEVGQPTLIIAGRHDPVIPPRQAEEMARRMPRAELVVWEECGHVPQVEWPERFVAKVDSFLAAIG